MEKKETGASSIYMIVASIGMVLLGFGLLEYVFLVGNPGTPNFLLTFASFFILVNSIAGLLGQYSNPEFVIDWNLTSILLITVFIGGQIGSRMSTNYFTPIQLKKATAILIAFVGIRILWEYLFP